MIFFFISCSPSSTSTQTEGDFSALTYNIHGLPAAITQDDTALRIDQIAPLLNNFPVVALQEDWMLENHNTITEQTQHPTQLYFDDRESEDKVYGSGLTLLSQFSLNNYQHIHYGSCFGYLENSSDCFASKGLQFAEIALSEEVNLHLYNTHLEAGGGEEDHLIREQHIETIIQTIETYSADAPLVLMGDFNLRYSDTIDLPLLEELTYSLDLNQSCFETQCNEEYHIDQIFFRSSDTVLLTAQSWTRHADFVDAQGQELSDHPAISTLFSWQYHPFVD